MLETLETYEYLVPFFLDFTKNGTYLVLPLRASIIFVYSCISCLLSTSNI